MSRAPVATPLTTSTELDREPPIPLTGVLSVLLGAALFGTLGPLSRFAYDAGLTPPSWVAWRAGIGAIATIAYVIWRVRTGRSHLIRPSDLEGRAKRLLLLAALMAFTLNLSMFIAFDRISIALALLGFYLYPAMTAVANAILGRERLDRTRLAALGLALAGMVAVVVAELDPSAGIRLDAIGLGLALGAAVSQTVFVVVSRDGYPTVPTEQAMAFILSFTAIGATILAVATTGIDGWLLPLRSPTVLPLMLSVGIFAAAIPSFLFLTGVRTIGGLRAGILMLFEPVVGVVLAAWLLKESLAPIQVVGGVAILAAAVLIQRGSREPELPIPGVGRSVPIRILLVDDHAMVRRGMRDFLALHADLEVVGEAGDGIAALAATEELAPDVVIMDLLMPNMDGIAATAEIKSRFPDVEVIALTSFIDEERVTAALEAGASGFLLKDAEADDLAAAIRAAVAGEVHLHPAVAGIVARGLRDRADPRPGRGRAGSRGETTSRGRGARADIASLTAREREVLSGVARGLSNKAIAEELGIAERTARTHVSNVLAKLGLTSRTQAALFAVEHGLGPKR